MKSEYDSFKPGPKNDQETLATIFFGIKDEELVAVYVYSTGKYSTVLYMPYGVEPAEIMSALERMYVLVEALSLTWVR